VERLAGTERPRGVAEPAQVSCPDGKQRAESATLLLVLVLFDLDGTLTDPYEGITESVAYALDSMGLPPLDSERRRAFIGPPLWDSFAALGLGPAAVQEAVALYRERFTQQGIFENRVYDGVAEALAELSGRSVQMAVATSKPTAFAERIIEHFGLEGFFDVVGGATLDGTRRHKADIIRLTLSALAPLSSQAVMVGDRAQDVLGARAHGLPSIGVRWGYAEPGELEAAGAQQIVDAPAELVSAVTGCE